MARDGSKDAPMTENHCIFWKIDFSSVSFITYCIFDGFVPKPVPFDLSRLEFSHGDPPIQAFPYKIRFLLIFPSSPVFQVLNKKLAALAAFAALAALAVTLIRQGHIILRIDTNMAGVINFMLFIARRRGPHQLPEKHRKSKKINGNPWNLDSVFCFL